MRKIQAKLQNLWPAYKWDAWNIKLKLDNYEVVIQTGHMHIFIATLSFTHSLVIRVVLWSHECVKVKCHNKDTFFNDDFRGILFYCIHCTKVYFYHLLLICEDVFSLCKFTSVYSALPKAKSTLKEFNKSIRYELNT